MRQVKHSKKPDTSRNPEGVDELVERQMARDEELRYKMTIMACASCLALIIVLVLVAGLLVWI